MCKPKSAGGLGFKDLCTFNLALLAKQGWRILQHPESLVAQIFRARYFSQVGFMHAPVKSNASYIWRSIAEARVIQLGVRWRVGDRRSINVWGDNWLPRQILFKVISPIPAGMDASFKVSNLILEDGT